MRTEVIQFLKQQLGQHVEGQASGFSQWLNGKLLHISDAGDLEMSFEVRPEMLNPFQVLHGGMVSAILDEAMGMQLYIKSSDAEAFLALNLSVDFMKACRVGEVLTARPLVVRKGKRTATLTCQLTNSKGDLVAQASSNFMHVGELVGS